MVPYSIKNARQHEAKHTLQKLKDFKWETLQRSPYFSDLTTSDLYLVRCLQNNLNDEIFDSENYLITFLQQKYEISMKMTSTKSETMGDSC